MILINEADLRCFIWMEWIIDLIHLEIDWFNCFDQRGCGRDVWDARQGQRWNALLGRILWRGNQKRESLQADGCRSQRQDYKECKFDILLMDADHKEYQFAHLWTYETRDFVLEMTTLFVLKSIQDWFSKKILVHKPIRWHFHDALNGIWIKVYAWQEQFSHYLEVMTFLMWIFNGNHSVPLRITNI